MIDPELRPRLFVLVGLPAAGKTTRARALEHECRAVGLAVALDFGVWTRNERSALRHLCTEIGATCALVVVDVKRSERLRRIQERIASIEGAEFDAERNARDEAL